MRPFSVTSAPAFASRNFPLRNALEEASFYTALSATLNIYKVRIAYPLAGMAIGAISAGLVIKLAESYNFNFLSQIIRKCYNIADRTKLVRIILSITLIIGCYWMPLTTFFATIPLAFLNTVYGIRNIQLNRK